MLQRGQLQDRGAGIGFKIFKSNRIIQDPHGSSWGKLQVHRLPGAEATSPSRAMGLSASISSKSRTQFLDNAILRVTKKKNQQQIPGMITGMITGMSWEKPR